jgi:predicted phosphodiesterase
VSRREEADTALPRNYMRLLVLSDLHREVWYRSQTWYEGKVDPFPTISPATSRPDAIVLAGDIDLGDRAIAWALEAFPQLPVLYVPGNHEAYGDQLEASQRSLADACAATRHIHYLNRREVVLGSVRFLGATLWTDFLLHGAHRRSAAMHQALTRLNDYARIRVSDTSGRYLTPGDTANLHREDVAWLNARLAQQFDGKTVVITHMAPSVHSISLPHRGSDLSAAFASNLDSLVKRADLWIHGHTHSSADYRMGQCRVISNPLGYPRGADLNLPENDAFDPNWVVEV